MNFAKLFVMSFVLFQSLARLALASASRDDRALITWAFSDTSGVPLTSRSFLFTENQNLYHLLVAGLPEYRHDFFCGSVLRIEHELKKGPRICYPASSNAEARKQFTYLTPLYVSPSVVLVLRKNLAEKFKTASGKISFRKLLKNKSLRPILSEGRSYGPILDKIINEIRPDVPRHITQPFVVNTVDIISHDRADYSIEYDFIIKEYLTSNSRNGDVTIVPIEEILSFNTQYLACSKTPEGLEIIRKVDKFLRVEAKKPAYRDAILAFNANHENKEFLRAVEEFIRTRDDHPQIIE